MLDELMPPFDVEEAHTVLIQAARERAYEAFKKVTPAEVRLRLLSAIKRRAERRAVA